MPVRALNFQEETQIIEEVERYLALVEQEFGVDMPRIPIRFDLIGNTVGMYCRKKGEHSIRFNSYAFAKYWHESFAETIPHEVAHYVSDGLFDHRYIKPHGREWRSIMYFFGADPKTRCDFDLSDIPKREIKRFDYVCHCSSHQLTAIRHNRIRLGKRRYFCRKCSSELRPAA